MLIISIKINKTYKNKDLTVRTSQNLKIMHKNKCLRLAFTKTKIDRKIINFERNIS